MTAMAAKQTKSPSTCWKFFTKFDDLKLLKCTICNQTFAYHGSTTVMREHMKRKHPAEFAKAAAGNDRDVLAAAAAAAAAARNQSPAAAAKRAKVGCCGGSEVGGGTGIAGLAPSCVGGGSSIVVSARHAKLLDGSGRQSRTSLQRAEQITELVAKFLVKDVVSVSTVAGEGFRQLVSFLEPEYSLPTCSRFAKILDDQYEVWRDKLYACLQTDAADLAISADVWTGCSSGEAYVTISVHFVDAKWTKRSHVLETRPLCERHTADEIASWIEDTVSKFVQNPSSKLMAMVHDNGRNIVAAAEQLKDRFGNGWESLRCSAHTLQLCIQAGLSVAPVEQTLVVARKLVEHFKSNPQAMSELNKWQQQMQVPEHDLLQDLRGRWITTFLMIQRLLEQRWPAAAVVSDCQVTKSKTNLNLRADQWELLAEVVAALEPVQVATAFLGAEYNVSVSVLLPVLFGILRAMEPKPEDSATIKHVKGLVSSEVKSRWGLDRVDGSNPTVPLLAAALDPRFKSLKFLDEEKRMQMQCSLYKIAERQALSAPPSAEDQQAASGDSALVDKSASALDLLLGEDPPQVHVHVAATNSSPWYTPVQNKCQDEIQRFVMDTPAPREMNPLAWWAANENRFPILGRVARSYFSIPSTAAPTERVFDPSVSGAAVDMDRRRSALAPADVDTIVFLHSNCDR